MITGRGKPNVYTDTLLHLHSLHHKCRMECPVTELRLRCWGAGD